MRTSRPRPKLLLFCARYGFSQKNAIAATLAWAAETQGFAFDVYYDAVRGGRHYGGGEPGHHGLALLTGGLVSGGRHLEALTTALHRFETTVICAGPVAFANPLAALSGDAGAAVHLVREDLVEIYEAAFGALGVAWPDLAVMLEPEPVPGLADVDAYLWPEVFHRQALGLASGARPEELRAILDRQVRVLIACGLSADRRAELAGEGFRVLDLGGVDPADDYASLTARIARRWSEGRRGWMLADPVLAAYWLPVACRERRALIYSKPAAKVLDSLAGDIAATPGPAVLGRQTEDADFFQLSELGQCLQVVDPGRPPLPVLLTQPAGWAAVESIAESGEPSDAELLAFASEGRVLVSLLFWTGMIRELENLYALADLVSLTGLKAGFVLTAQSFAQRPSPLDLLTVPRDQGGLYPHVEVLLGSSGTGVSIESSLGSQRLAEHLAGARRELDDLGVPAALRPSGWWATMDARLIRRPRWQSPGPLGWNPASPYRLQFRFQPGQGHQANDRDARAGALRENLAGRLKGSRLRSFFRAYRPYEEFAPGPFSAEIADAVRHAGFTYMFSKSGFGSPPRVLYEKGEFVALNYTAGRWDGWTPFETINDVADLRQAEKELLATNQPGWLVGTLDSCLWAFSGELWRAAPGLAAIARFAASGGSSGRLLNVTPRVVARYARLLSSRGSLAVPRGGATRVTG